MRKKTTSPAPNPILLIGPEVLLDNDARDHAKRSRTMPVKIPQPLRTMLEDKAYGHVVTFNAQGKPELTMVWMDVEGDELLFNTADGRRKPNNIRRDPRVIVSVQDRNNRANIRGLRRMSRVTDGVPTRTSTSSSE